MRGRRSARALDWLNFFLAEVQTGFGPFVAVYLTSQEWTEFEIGLALSVGTLTAMLSQVPAGALVDATRRKRLVAFSALLSLALSALIFAAWPDTLPVLGAEVLHGFASCILNPAVAAISLALVGQAALGERLGRNARYRAIGNGITAGLMGLVGTYLSGAAVFWLTAILTLPAMFALTRIRAADLAPREEEMQHAAAESGWKGLRNLVTDRGVLVFSACCALFALSNAAMLPLAGAEATARAGRMANLIIAACIVVPQLVTALISPWFGRLAAQRGRRLVLLLGLGALPLRGLLLALVEHPFALVLVQALDGISATAFGILLPLLAADLTRGSRLFNTGMGVFGLASGIGATASTTVAGALAAHYGTGIAFAALAGAGLLAFALALLAMPETRPELPEEAPEMRDGEAAAGTTPDAAPPEDDAAAWPRRPAARGRTVEPGSVGPQEPGDRA
ncbi:MFS transporter [Roseicella sp. DB1501]|uniref:MFS transporter n=1 Tax=Roseicella sp. DB1501 TaxID=2730925 RepID=UPI00149158B9|nr:MFS transporter [Roseicella sp. DB1501]NOG71411.1 MFS transporter [Roseicella sp. DB1501]